MPDRIPDALSLWGWIQLGVGVAFTWLCGEAARPFLAGAAGGLTRWLIDDKRRLRDGLVAVLAGVLCARYCEPLVAIILSPLLPPATAGASGVAGFVAGLWGMGMAKVLLTLLEVFARRVSGVGGGSVE